MTEEWKLMKYTNWSHSKQENNIYPAIFIEVGLSPDCT